MPEAAIELPLLRVPVSVIIDDSAPCINLAWYWLKQREDWWRRCRPGEEPTTPLDYFQKIEGHPRAIPAAFAEKFGTWSIEEGVKGKFSFIPCPAGLGNCHERIDGHSDGELQDWLRAARDVIRKNWDLTPEMITHTAVMDLEKWELTDVWEQAEWAGPVEEQLFTDYIAKALELLREVEIDCPGVTSPGGFGGKMEEAYARATQAAARQVNGTERPYYFKRIYVDKPPEVPVKYADAEAGTAVMSIIACTGDWFGGWTGFTPGSADKFITADGQGGRLPEVIAEGQPAVMCGHWPGFYYNGEEHGFEVLKTVKQRLDEHCDNLIWMKVSEITDYWCARALASVERIESEDVVRVRVRNAFAVPRFTLRVSGVQAPSVAVGRHALEAVKGARRLAPGRFLHDGDDTVAAFDLEAGTTEVTLTRP